MISEIQFKLLTIQLAFVSLPYKYKTWANPVLAKYKTLRTFRQNQRTVSEPPRKLNIKL